MRRLSGFTAAGYTKGRSALVQALWVATQHLVFYKWWLPPRLRPPLLRAFGAQIGHNVFIRHRVRVLWPWKLSIGNDCWIGEDVWLLNLEDIVIEHDVCLSQGAFLCAGSHDRRSETFEYDNGPITVRAGAWIAARAVVLRGVEVGANAVIPAGGVADRSVPDGDVLQPRTR
jgi:putative colanic acid biosynthesis acetyltransferase WcaF